MCPNKYLATQVCQEARKFGIPFTEISQSNELPDDFLSGSKILITHIQKIFNGKSKFGLANKSVDVGAIVIDDSHACIDAIRNSLTIKISKDHDLYSSILMLCGDEIREQGEGSFQDIQQGDYDTMLPIPYWTWFDKYRDITSKILESKNTNEVKFTWPVIKDMIKNCQAFISGKSLEIIPSLIPIDSFGSFSRAKHRVLMSATTQDDSFFIKGLGFDIDSVARPLTNQEQKWSGEKLILIPSLIHEDLDREMIVNYWGKVNSRRNFGVVSLIPSFIKKGQYERIGSFVVDTDNIYKKVQELKNGCYEKTLVFANRYDGIDLPDDSCRILILDSKPFFDSLLDRYEEQCRISSDIINIRIAQKIEQGLGRSVRGDKDYSVILLVGGDLIKFVKSSGTSKYFSAQTQKQIEIGIQVAEFSREDADDSLQPSDMLLELLDQLLKRDEAWKEYYSEEMKGIGEEEKRKSLYELLKKEYDAEKYFSSGELEKACDKMQSLCDEFSGDKSEKGWYLQQLARYKYQISKVASNEIQKSAFTCNSQLLKPKEGISYSRLEYINENRVSRIRTWISQYTNYQDMMISIDGILQDLSFGIPSEKFEAAIHEIGQALGFLCQRPDKEIKKGPDNLWCVAKDQYFLIECKSEVKADRSEITKHESGQMNTHSAWFEDVYRDANCKRILIIPTKTLSYNAAFTHEVEIMRKKRKDSGSRDEGRHGDLLRRSRRHQSLFQETQHRTPLSPTSLNHTQ